MFDSQFLIAVLVLALLIALVVFHIRPLLAFAGVGAALFITGAVEQTVYLDGFTNSSLMTLMVLIICSFAVEKTYHVRHLGASLFNGKFVPNYVKLLVVSSFTSAFSNNTAVVATLMGCIKKNLPSNASKYLLPLSYASILGGTLTLVGTSTNLIVSGFAQEAGLVPLSMLTTTPVAIVVVGICLVCLLCCIPLLPSSKTQEQHRENTSYFIEAQVLAVANDQSLVGKTVFENGLRDLGSLYLSEIIREGGVITPVLPNEVLQSNDRLMFSGDINALETLQQFKGLKTVGAVSEQDAHISQTVEAILVADSVVVGKTIKQVKFRSLFDASVIGIRRGNQKLSGGLGNTVLQAGDMLLLAIGNDFKDRNNLKRNFVFLDGADFGNHSGEQQTLSKAQSRWVLGGFVAVIGLSAIGLLPLLKGLLILLGAYVITGILNVQYVRRRIPFEIIVIVGSALALAHAMQTSGLADTVSGSLLTLTNGYGVYGAFIGVFLATLLLTELITNNAAAAIIFPIALATAQQYGADPMPFVMAVAFGASASFLSPFGYQTNLMVYSAGNYSIKDYVKLGLPLSIVYSITALVMIPVVYPF
ncbi:SLC13 family permease [Vibrio coralliirubri]|uniref:SLC13 family permease n=1 Tax=Vibrio coralliirubri TaxID=1516159 RepID=UPI000EFC915E|nr:SLC13 family permease [Vibrio coralliirubri]